MLTISEIKKTKNSVNPVYCFSQLQRAGQSYRPGGRRQEFATKLALGANLAENTKLTETPLCPLWLFSNPIILSNSFKSLCLCALMPLWICPFSSTIVENPLQIDLFMQNKPNSPNVQMNLTYLSTMNYVIFTCLTKVKNKPNSNPIKPCPERSRMGQSPKSPNEYKLIYNKGLQKKR